MSLSKDDLNRLAETLAGSSSMLADVVWSLFDYGKDDLTEDDLLELDDLVSLCETCGWWCEADEMGEDTVCRECENEA